MPLGGTMTLIDHNKEDEYIYPLPPIFETDDVLPPDLVRGPKPSGKRGPRRPPTYEGKQPQKGSRKRPEKGSKRGSE